MGRICDPIVKLAEWARAWNARREARDEKMFERMGEILERTRAAMDKATTEEKKQRILSKCSKELGELT